MLKRHGDGIKRALDITISATALLLLAPVLLTVAVLVLASLGRPMLFRQPRAGLGGREFALLKFRTMREAYDREGAPLPDEERLPILGRFLRSTSLDELPGLINVLRGEMSMVGPRPLLLDYIPLYTPRQTRRHEVKPGITGWAQVNGRNAVSWENKLEMDVWYVEHRSVLLDLKILLITLCKVLKREGISQPGHVTAERFRGSVSIRSGSVSEREPELENGERS